MKQQYVYALAAFLAVVGLSVFFYKWQVLDFPVTRDQEASVWTIESTISFDSGPGSIKVNLLVPTLTPGFRMLNENSVSRGYGFSLNYGSGGREAQWTIRRADGAQTIYYRITVFEDAGSEQADTTPPFPPPPAINEPFKTAVDVIVAEVREHSADTASFTTELLRRLNDPSPDPNVELLLAGVESEADFVGIATTLLALTNSMHEMIWSAVETPDGLKFTDVSEHSWFNRVQAPFMYGLFIYSAFALAGRLPNIAPAHRKTVMLMLGCAILPFVVSVSNIYLGMGPEDFPFSALSFVIMLPLYSYAAVSMRFYEFSPIAYKTLFDHVRDPIFVLDHEERIVCVNRSAQGLLGAPDQPVRF